MNPLNVSTKHLTEATHFLTTELIGLIPGANAAGLRTALTNLLEDFAHKQYQQDLRGHALFQRARLTAVRYVSVTPACARLSPFFQTWVSCQLSRTLLLGCGCYQTNSCERSLHWAHYKPLLAAVQQLDRPGGNGAPDSLYDWSDALVKLRPAASPN